MSQSSNTVIKVDNISKEYFLGAKSSGNLRTSLGSIFRKKKKSKPFLALNHISFELSKGEILGVIGKNGAGKSTLLKILSKITAPSKGRIEITGRVASLLEVGTGFHPELTGRENIFLNGTILGMTRKEVDAKLDEIVAFSGISEFIDTPVKRYSSGMYVRLAFAVAAHLEPEILIIDEVLAVGDYEFQKKCLGKMEEVANSGRTVIFVSHNLQAVRNLCNVGMVLANGEISHFGKVEDSIAFYMKGRQEFKKEIPLIDNKHRHHQAIGELVFRKIEFENQPIKFGEDICFKISLKSVTSRPFMDIEIAVAVYDKNENCLIHVSNKYIQKLSGHSDDMTTYSFEIKNELRPGVYKTVLFIRDAKDIQDWILDDVYFEISDGNPYAHNLTSEIKGLVMPKFKYELIQR